MCILHIPYFVPLLYHSNNDQTPPPAKFAFGVANRKFNSKSLVAPPYSFPLKHASSIIRGLSGLSGVYMLINKVNPSSFYIGSSVNLGRRLNEYYNIVNGVRQPNTSFERALTRSSISDWEVMINAIVPKHLVLNN